MIQETFTGFAMPIRCLVGFLLATAQPAIGQTVYEFYQKLPDQELGILVNPDEPQKKSKEFRDKALEVKDVKRGFLATKNGVQLAKFNRKDKMPPLFAISWGSYPEDGRIRPIAFFTTGAKGQWRDVTSEILPEIPMLVIDAIDQLKCQSSKLSDSASGTYRYTLPRRGTTILAEVNSDRGPPCQKTLFELNFDGRSFAMKI